MISKATTDEHIDGIIALQKRNLPRNLTLDLQDKYGFLTVEHDRELLLKMNSPHPHVVAFSLGRVVGYALVMERRWKDKIEVLFSMFNEIDERLRLRQNSNLKYFVMGQVCVDESFRGKGVFRQLYQRLHDQMSSQFDSCITEIDMKNIRSIQAHLAVGFKEFHQYTDKQGVEWMIVRFDYT